LTDEQGNWLRRYGYACTDKRGYFELTIKLADSLKGNISASGTMTEEEKKRLAEEKARAAANTPSGTVAPAAAPGILRVFSRDGRALHTEKEPVAVKANALDYRLILLGDEEA